MRTQKFGISVLLLVMMLIGVVFVALASANSSQDTLSKGEIFEFNESNSQRIPLPDFDLTFDDLRKDPNVLEIKGKIPHYDTQAERQNWLGKLNNISRVLARDDLSPYAYPKGPVLAHSFGMDGTIKVYLYEGTNFTDTQINEIYNVINTRGNKENIQDVPVVFIKSGFIQNLNTTLGAAEETNLSAKYENLVELNNSNNSTSESDNGSSSNRNESSKRNSAPGFGLLGTLTCLYGGWKFRQVIPASET